MILVSVLVCQFGRQSEKLIPTGKSKSKKNAIIIQRKMELLEISCLIALSRFDISHIGTIHILTNSATSTLGGGSNEKYRIIK